MGDRKTVIRAGTGIIFDHPGTEALNFEQNRNNYLFSSQTQTNYGTGDPATDLANDPRFTSVTALPSGLSTPQQPTVPFTPYVDASGTAFGEAASTFNYADGHAATRKWVDPVMIKYSASMDQNKFSNSPNDRTAPHDVRWLAERYPSKLNP